MIKHFARAISQGTYMRSNGVPRRHMYSLPYCTVGKQLYYLLHRYSRRLTECRYSAYKLLPRQLLSPFPYNSLQSLVFAAIKQFSHTALRPDNRLPVESRDQKNPEAAFQAEFYRAVHQLTTGRVIPSPEFSDHSIGLQRIDFRIAEVNWGVEMLKDGDDLREHYGRFSAGGKYSRLGLVDWVVIDFRVSSVPRKAHSMSPHTPYEDTGEAHYAIDSMPNLYHVVFDKTFSMGQILNNTLEKVVPMFRLSR
jgi:hypothetical protein